MSPNWLLNMVSPILGIPLHMFFLSVLIGESAIMITWPLFVYNGDGL